MKPKFITFTGADDKTDPEAMAALAADFPVEFGILYSEKLAGHPRYPSSFLKFKVKGLNLSLHVCGKAAREIAAGTTSFTGLHGGFKRVQINGINGSEVNLETAAKFAENHQVEVILQSGNPNIFPEDDRVSWLFDRSGGRGETPMIWPFPHKKNTFVGYAGGLGPLTVGSYRTIEREAGLTPYWLDMETNVRNENDEFDLTLCRRVCVVVYGKQGK